MHLNLKMIGIVLTRRVHHDVAARYQKEALFTREKKSSRAGQSARSRKGSDLDDAKQQRIGRELRLGLSIRSGCARRQRSGREQLTQRIVLRPSMSIACRVEERFYGNVGHSSARCGVRHVSDEPRLLFAGAEHPMVTVGATVDDSRIHAARSKLLSL